MFELNTDEHEITLISNIGEEKRNALIIDNFYKNPDEVRQLALDSHQWTKDENPGLIVGLPGKRVHEIKPELSKNLEPFFYELTKEPLWRFEFNPVWWDRLWQDCSFVVNITRDMTYCESNPQGGLVPHQDSFDTHFGCVIYLNTPEECQGGTRIYSYDGVQSFSVPGNLNQELSRKMFNDKLSSAIGGNLFDPRETSRREFNEWVRDYVNGNIPDSPWKTEAEFEMKYNRCILYESDNLHSQWADKGMFNDHDRLAQVLFM